MSKGKYRDVILNQREQDALASLLSETWNGSAVAGIELPTQIILAGIKKRLRRDKNQHLMEAFAKYG